MYPIITKPFKELTLDEYHRIVEARETVFFLEQHITETDADDIDLRSTFMWMEDAGRVIAFLRIIPAGCGHTAEASVGRVMTDAAYRRRGLSRKLMHCALDYIETQWDAQSIRISAQKYLTGFYASLGFEVVSETYLEAGIEHVEMLRG